MNPKLKTHAQAPILVPAALVLSLLLGSGCDVLKNDNPKGGSSSGSSPSGCVAGNLPSAAPNAPLPIGESSSSQNTVSGVTAAAQSFMLNSATAPASVAGVVLQLKAIVPAGQTVNSTLTVSIQTSNGTGPSGQPSGAMAGSATVIASAISANGFSNYTFNFPSAATLLPNTLYWLVAEGNGSLSSTNFIEWGAGTTGNLPTDIFISVIDVASGNMWIPPVNFVGGEAELYFGIGCSGNSNSI